MPITINISATDALGAIAQAQVSVTATSGGYNNLVNWPSPVNRPQLAGTKLTWIGPSYSDSGGHPSTSNDVQQSITLINSGGFNPGVGQNYTGLKITAGSGVLTMATGSSLHKCYISGTGAQSTIVMGDNCTIEDCMLEGLNLGSVTGYNPLYIAGRNCTVRRNTFKGLGTGINTGFSNQGATLIVDNLLYNFQGASATHWNGIWISGHGGGLLDIEHNTIYNNQNQTDAIMCDNWQGTVSNVKWDNNIFCGGCYNFYIDNRQGSGNINAGSLICTNNHMGGNPANPVYYGEWFLTVTPGVYAGNVNDGWALVQSLGLG